jgi:hypothetical protein
MNNTTGSIGSSHVHIFAHRWRYLALSWVLVSVPRGNEMMHRQLSQCATALHGLEQQRQKEPDFLSVQQLSQCAEALPSFLYNTCRTITQNISGHTQQRCVRYKNQSVV